MTSLIAWVAGHTKGQSSLNIATDNRISWTTPDGGRPSVGDTWDQGRKVFASKRYPIIVGYCGDVLYPVVALPALLDRIDAGGVPSDYVTHDEIKKVVDSLIGRLKTGWEAYPKKARLTIYIGYREDLSIPAPSAKESPSFHLLRLETRASLKTWNITNIKLPEISQAVAFDGSGSRVIRTHVDAWNETTSGYTSRAIYAGFVDAIVSRADPLSGGAPQLGSIYRQGAGRLVGIIHGDRAYYAGMSVDPRDDLAAVEFRNDTFERVDSKGYRVSGAQKQERPTELADVNNVAGK